MSSTEGSVGINAWANSLPGFTGILKQRYSDFMVNEIDTSGTVVHLDRPRAAQVPSTSDWRLAPSSTPAASSATAQQQALTALPHPEPQPDICFPASTAANGSEQSIAAANSNSTAQQAPLQQPHSNNTQANPVANVAQDVPYRVSPTEICQTGNYADGFVTETLKQTAATAAQPAMLEGIAACAAQLDAVGIMCGPSNKQKLKVFLQSIFDFQEAINLPRAGSLKRPEHILLDPITDKAQRTAVHNFFKQYSPLPKLGTSTVTGSGVSDYGGKPMSVIKVTYEGRGQKRKRDDRGGRGLDKSAGRGSDTGGKGAKEGPSKGIDAGGQWGRDWPGGPRKYCKFALAKTNMDTQQCIGLLTSLIHCKRGVFATAGTKDKRAVTVQSVTAFKVSAERLAALNPRLYNFQVGNFDYTDEELHLGQLQGNQFQITLRELKAATRYQIEAAAAALKEGGFINYYGLQRFGSGSVPTHKVGATLLRGRYEEAVRLIMQPRDGEREETAEARRLYLEKGDVTGALSKMQRHLTAERAILEGLSHSGKDNFLAALMRIPHGLRTMYVHAYQSYLWNAATSERCLKHGTKSVVQGDLVLPVDSPQAEEHHANGATGGERSSTRRAAVHVVTAEEACSGVYSIQDVVLPLPGGQIQYPEYKEAEDHDTSHQNSIYHRLAAADNVSLEPASAMSDNNQAFSLHALSGDYRRIVVKPQGLTWKLLEYSNPDEPLAVSELEQLSGDKEPAALQGVCQCCEHEAWPL
ncbi:TPA: hypothetical protein ACH3X1_013389 [Trebouxia sp. C0004]